MEFTVATGDDDLRSASIAWVSLVFPDGTKQQCSLHDDGEQSWDNDSKHPGHQCILRSPMNWGQLRETKMILGFDGRLPQTYMDTGDNWNVNEVRVIAIDTADKHFPCLLDAKGGPYLTRMTGSHKSYELTETVNRC